MKNTTIFVLMIEHAPNEAHELELDEEQSNFYMGRIPQRCSRNNLFNVLNLVKQSRPQAEIDFFENIVLLTKNEYYKVGFKAVPAIAKHEPEPLYKDIRITPQVNRDLILICYDNTIVSPVRFCGRHFHSGVAHKAIRPNAIYKWAYREDFAKKFNLPAMDPELSKQIDEQITEETKQQSSGTTLLEIILEVVKDIADEQKNKTNKPIYH